MTARGFDVVVVGAGSAGCVVAGRLSEDPACRVLLVEAGPDPQPIPDVIMDPRRQTEVILESPYVRLYEVERPDGSTFPLISGKVTGGSSSVNNMSIVRPIRRDFDAWATYGGAAWSYDALLPVMRAIEDDPDFGDRPIHGRGGPVRLHRSWMPDGPSDPPVHALIAAAADRGLPVCEDLNVAEPLGVCASPYCQVDGKRQSTAVSYLEPARGRPNLTIAAETTVARLVLDGSRVTGVELIGPDGARETVLADKVVLSAGVYHSPQILLLSGIGSPDALGAVGIPVLHRLDGVGEGFQDHAVVYVTFQGTQEMREDFVIPKVRLIAKSDPGLPYGDLHVFMRPSIRMEGIPPMLPVSIHLLDHRTRGRVWLTSADPMELPGVDPALLRDPGDIKAMTDAIAFVDGLVRDPRLAAFYGPMLSPESPDDWEEHVLSSYITYYHGVGTCRFGPDGDPLAVTDPTLRVRGIANLWVADASVLPTVPRANTNLAAIMVGEVAAKIVAEA